MAEFEKYEELIKTVSIISKSLVLHNIEELAGQVM